MPKIDIAKIPIDTSTGYPPPFNKAVEGRSRTRLGRAAGLTHYGVNVCTLREPDLATRFAGTAPCSVTVSRKVVGIFCPFTSITVVVRNPLNDDAITVIVKDGLPSNTPDGETVVMVAPVGF